MSGAIFFTTRSINNGQATTKTAANRFTNMEERNKNKQEHKEICLHELANMFLTDIDLYNLTGYIRYAGQARWLRDNGWPFALGRDGKPRVLIAVLQAKLGDNAASEG